MSRILIVLIQIAYEGWKKEKKQNQTELAQKENKFKLKMQ